MKRQICFVVFFLFCFLMTHVNRLVASPGIPVIGQKAPDFALPDQNGKIHRLSNYRGKAVLLAFYPADFTSGCTLEAHTISRHSKEFLANGVIPFGISVQDSKSHKAFCNKEGITYRLLADTQKTVAAKYGVLNGLGVANRVTFIIGKDGKIAYVDDDVQSDITGSVHRWLNWAKQLKKARRKR